MNLGTLVLIVLGVLWLSGLLWSIYIAIKYDWDIVKIFTFAGSIIAINVGLVLYWLVSKAIHLLIEYWNTILW